MSDFEGSPTKSTPKAAAAKMDHHFAVGDHKTAVVAA